MNGLRWHLANSVGLSSISGTINVLMIGQSNNAGDTSQTDTTYGGAALAAGVSCRKGGTDLTNWPTNPGFAPHLAAALLAAGATAVRIVDRSVSGSPISATRTTYLYQAFNDAAALGWGTFHFCHKWQGEYEANSITGSNDLAVGWQAEYFRLMYRVRKHSPNARILCQELVTTEAAYTHRAAVLASQAAAIGQMSNAALISGTGIATVFDGVHIDPDDADGYPLAATRCSAVFTP